MSAHAVELARNLREIVHARSSGLCEHAECGKPLGSYWELHHRQLRSQGGLDCPCNGVALHGACHRTAPAAPHYDPERAAELGLYVPAWASPESMPLVLPRVLGMGGSALLSCGGTYI